MTTRRNLTNLSGDTALMQSTKGGQISLKNAACSSCLDIFLDDRRPNHGCHQTKATRAIRLPKTALESVKGLHRFVSQELKTSGNDATKLLVGGRELRTSQ